ncbi:Uncharacterized protein Adt_46565 [Abeliophyllum distichum]|uniref:Gag-pol polyprotein n=1 Tax=Abeliophyllum distichum TaxID=126358 RepID=A0ABD1NZ61_9LAMI
MSAVVTAMMNGTHSHPFKMSLSKNPHDMMHELLRRGDKYGDTEEAFFNTKGMKDRKEPESNKRKTRDEPRSREDKSKGENLKVTTCPHDDALVIVANIVDFDVKKVLVDNGNAANIISWIVFLGLKISLSKIKHVTTPLYEFVGATIIPERAIELPVTLGT